MTAWNPINGGLRRAVVVAQFASLFDLRPSNPLRARPFAGAHHRLPIPDHGGAPRPHPPRPHGRRGGSGAGGLPPVVAPAGRATGSGFAPLTGATEGCGGGKGF